jgi:hypothetical protein
MSSMAWWGESLKKFASANERMTSAYHTGDTGQLRICEVDVTIAAGVRSRWHGGCEGVDTWSIISECNVEDEVGRWVDQSGLGHAGRDGVDKEQMGDDPGTRI